MGSFTPWRIWPKIWKMISSTSSTTLLKPFFILGGRSNNAKPTVAIKWKKNRKKNFWKKFRDSGNPGFFQKFFFCAPVAIKFPVRWKQPFFDCSSRKKVNPLVARCRETTFQKLKKNIFRIFRICNIYTKMIVSTSSFDLY